MSVTAYINAWDLFASANGVQTSWFSLDINMWGMQKVTLCISLAKIDATGDTKATAYVTSAKTFRDLGGGVGQTQTLDFAADATSHIVLDNPISISVLLEVDSRNGNSRVDARAVCFLANTDPSFSY
jgi:hypothetical protein